MDFFISDTHFGHSNIIKYCGRPFKDSDEMDKFIIDNWNSVVGKEDTVYHLGDFSLVKQYMIPSYVERLNGKMLLLMGNHDRRKTVTAWGKVGVNAIKRPMGYMTPTGEVYALSHEPLRFPDVTNIHGHSHGNTHRGDPGEHGTFVCVSCEVTNYSPVTIEWVKQVEKAIKEGLGETTRLPSGTAT